MKTTRRDIMMFAGGSAMGVLFTPAPWRLITDTALWSENWPGIPVPSRAEIRTRFTNCSLCPAGCAVRARCSGDQPVQLSGVTGHPVSRGGLCAFGLAGHHLPYLPNRVKQGNREEASKAVADAIAQCGPSEHVVTLDLRPGRTTSWTYRRAMAAVKNGVYAAPSSAAMGDVAVDLAAAKTVVSFGVPVLDGWGTPGNVFGARSGFRLVQVEPVESRSASLADLWLRVSPGSEDALAQALAGTLPASAAADATGLPQSQIADVAARLKDDGPVLVLGSSQLPSTGRTVISRRPVPVPADWQKAAPVTDLASMPDHSVRVLIIDESAQGDYIPWNVIAPKLTADPVVVALAWSPDGYARHARCTLPTGVYPEVAGDVPAAVDSVAATFRLSVPLVAVPSGAVKPEEFVAAAAGLTIRDTLRERADAIHKTGRGSVFSSADGKTAALTDVTADEFWKALNAGGCWIDSPDEKAQPSRLSFAAAGARQAEEADLPLVAVLTYEQAPASPILSKVYRESNLRLKPDRVALHPSCGIPDGSKATLQTVLGKWPVDVTLDAGVPAGIVQVSASPAILDLCAPGARAGVVRS